jgi:hypothetical protein
MEVMVVDAPVMAGLVPAIHVLSHCLKDVDARPRPGMTQNP